MENLEQLAANQDQSEPQQKLSINPSTQQYRVGKINTLTNNNEIHDNKPSHSTNKSENRPQYAVACCQQRRSVATTHIIKTFRTPIILKLINTTGNEQLTCPK